jgi:hypothetical protein
MRILRRSGERTRPFSMRRRGNAVILAALHELVLVITAGMLSRLSPVAVVDALLVQLGGIGCLLWARL